VKKRVLVLSSRVPYPLIGGDRVRIYNFSRVLSQEYAVDLLAIDDVGVGEAVLKSLEAVFDNVMLFRTNRARLAANAAAGLLSRHPLQVAGYQLGSVRRWITRHFDQYQLLFCNHIRMAEYVRHLPCAKVLDFHDAISMNYADAISKAKGFWKAFYTLENRRLLPYEIGVLGDFDKSLITAKLDKEHLLRHAGFDADIEVVPMGVSETAFGRPAVREEENWIALSGRMDTYPNEAAAVLFAETVFPGLRKANSSLKFLVVGAYPSRKVRALALIPGVQVTGLVPDPYYYLERAKVVVAPMKLGAGIQNKVLEGMALGKAVVTTPMGAQGVDGEDGQHFVVADDVTAMAEKITWLLDDPVARMRLGQSARELVNAQYTWERIGARLLREVHEVCKP